MHPQQQIARLRNLMHGVGGAEQGVSAALSFLCASSAIYSSITRLDAAWVIFQKHSLTHFLPVNFNRKGRKAREVLEFFMTRRGREFCCC